MVQQLFLNCLAPSTHKNYQSGSKCFMTFCNLYNISSLFPVNEPLFLQFAMYLFKEGLKGEMVKNYMAVVKHSQISLGLSDHWMSKMP